MDAATHFDVDLPPKLRRPSAEGLVERPRLFAVLDAARRARAIWIHGPAGAGKTSLVSSWIASRGVDGLWFQLDASDADPATFFHLLGRGAQRGTTASLRLPMPPPGSAHSLTSYVQCWIRVLNETLPRPALIVLDNYQMIPPDAPLHAVIDIVLGVLAPHVTLIVASRSPPPPALAAWVGDPDFHSIDWEQLRLTEQEAVSFAAARGLSAPVLIGEMLARARGWAAGFTLQVLARTRGVTTGDTAHGAQQTIFEILATQMFDRLSRDRQERLVACALPPVISQNIAREVAGTDAAADLQALHTARAFVDRRVDAVGGEIYEFHPLLREFLVSRAIGVLGAERIADARRTIAIALEKEGKTEEAIAQWVALAHWDQAARVVVACAPAMLSQGRSRALSEWIGELPDDVVMASGWLSYWRGMVHGTTNPLLGRADVEHAYARFAECNDASGALVAAAEVLNQYFRARTDYGGVDAWLDRVEALYGAVESHLTPAVEATIVVGLAVCLDVGMAHPLWERVRRRLDVLLATTSTDPGTVGRIAAFGVRFAICRGDLVSARNIHRQVEAALDHPDLPPDARVAGRVCGIALHCADGRLGIAREQCKLAFESIDEHTPPTLGSDVMAATFHAELGAGDIDAAARSLDRLHPSRLSTTTMERAQRETLRAYILWSRGDRGAAIDALRDPLESFVWTGARLLALRTRAQLGHFLWLAGRHDEARAQLQQVVAEAAALQAAFVSYLAQISLAGSFLDTGDTTVGLDYLRRALASGARHDYLNAHRLSVACVMARLFATALEYDIEPDYVRRLIRHLNLQSPGPNVQGWPWAIRVYTLGRFALFIGDQRFDHGRKAQRRVLDLLKAVIAFGGVGVGREQLAAALWPDSDGAGALNALEVTLYRLRKLLGRDDAIRLEHGEVSLDRSVVWVDTLAFESLAVAADRMDVGNGDIEDAAHAAEKAMRLYYGPFLRFEEESAWQLPYQERLRSQYRRLMMVGARHWPASRAIDALERAIGIDPAAEELQRRLMTLLADAGRQAEAVEAYQRCERVLRATLGVTPSAETRAMLQRLGVTRPVKAGANGRAGATK